MKIKVGDIVITNGYEEWMYNDIKRRHRWIGKVINIVNSGVTEVKTICSDRPDDIGYTSSCYTKSLVPINEAIKDGTMYEDSEFKKEESTIRIEQGIHHIQTTGAFHLADGTSVIVDDPIEPVDIEVRSVNERGNQYLEGIRNMLEGDFYGRRRNQR